MLMINTLHPRMAVMHLTIKFGVDICIESRVIDIFLKFKMAAEFGHSGVLIVWYLCSISNLV